jgi:RNA polymerase sigma-70 factor (sigma-E family)
MMAAMSNRGDPTVPLAADGRWAVLEALHREHYGRLVRLAVLLVDRPETAEEIVQDAFVRLHRSLDRVAVEKRPEYLRSIVMNLARSRLRHRSVVRRHVEPVADRAPAADAHAHVHDDRIAVVAALRQLPRRQRECLVLRFYEDLSVPQIASSLGIAEGSVKSHLFRATQAMAQKLEAHR